MGKNYLHLIPFNPKKFFANWNLEFYKKYQFEDIITMDSAETNPTQFAVTRHCIEKVSTRLNRKIHLVLTAVGTGSIVDLVQNDLDFLSQFISSVTISDLKDFEINRWDKFKKYDIKADKKIGNLLDPEFVRTLTGDLIYGNEIFGDFPNWFLLKKRNKLYDFWIRAYTVNVLPPTIKEGMKKVLHKIYKEGIFPDKFSPELGKLLSFSIMFSKRIKDRILEDYYELYPNYCIIPVADSAFDILSNLYRQIPENGMLLFHDYGFFSPENLHLIKNFLRPDNTNNFVRNYYGEFTTDSSYDYLYHKLKPMVRNIRIKKTAERIAVITDTPVELVNLDGFEREASFFIVMIRERFAVWDVIENHSIEPVIDEYIQELKDKKANIEEFVEKINDCTDSQLTEDSKITIKKILKGYFNDDDHRFLTIEISK